MRGVTIVMLAAVLGGTSCTRDNPAFGLDGSGGGSRGDDGNDDTADDEDGDDDDDDDTADDDDDDTADDDDDDTADDDDDDTADDDDDDDDDECGLDQTCVPLPGAPWNGPVALWLAVGIDAELPGCGVGPYPDLIDTAFVDGFSLPGNACCFCGDPPTSCSDPDIIEFGNKGCSFAGSEVDWNPECTAFDPAEGAGYELTASYPIIANCPVNQAVNLPDPVPDGRARVCAGADAGAPCSSGVCVDKPQSQEGPCVVAPGHQDDCPPGFPDRHDLFDLDDQRDCGPVGCSCGESFGGECAAWLITHEDEECGPELAQLDAEECIDPKELGGVGSVSSFTEVLEPGQCNAINTEPAGEVVVIDVATVCCR